MSRVRVSLVLTFVSAACGCAPPAPQITRFHARPGAPSVQIEPGEHRLGLGYWRDGILYIPKAAASRRPLPLLVVLHGGGARADEMALFFPAAEELGVAVLAPDARDNTWDGIDSRIGPDVVFIDSALRHTLERVAVDPARLALAGHSDGASYALSLGLANGDLFTRLVALAPGSIFTPGPTVGRPSIFIAHGTRDRVLPIEFTSRLIVPQLRQAGYDVSYREFEGGHNITRPIARAALEWLAH